MDAAEAAEVVRDEPLLACGHPLSALVSGRVGRYCGACERELLREPPTRAQGSYLEDASEASEADPGDEPDGDEGDEPDDTPDSEEDEQHSPQTIEADADESEPLEGEYTAPDDIPSPAYGERNPHGAGPRGCNALNSRREPCAAAAPRDGLYCAAHSGQSVIAADPHGMSAKSAEAGARMREQRAAIKLALGSTRAHTPRGMLKLKMAEHASAVAGRAVAAILDPKADPIAAGRLALQAIDAADPLVHASVTVDLPTDPGALNGLSLSELVRLAELHDLDVPALAAPAEASGSG